MTFPLTVLGAGLAAGVNVFRRGLFGAPVALDIPLQVSTNRYVTAAGDLRVPLIGQDRLFLTTGLAYEDRPQEDFFGIGPGSLESDRSNFGLRTRTFAVGLGSDLGRDVTAGVRGALLRARVRPGSDRRFPTLAEAFPESARLAGYQGADLAVVEAFVRWDFRDSAVNPSSGGVWTLDAARHTSTGDGPFRFTRHRVEMAHYLPLGDRQVMAVRTLGTLTDDHSQAGVPFFLMPALGGKETMRGFREFRFQDTGALLFGAEYRWELWKFADAVLFDDEGQVASRISDLSVGRFRSSRGVGLRFKSHRAQVLRVDLGRSQEGWRFHLTMSPTF